MATLYNPVVLQHSYGLYACYISLLASSTQYIPMPHPSSSLLQNLSLNSCPDPSITAAYIPL